MSIIVTPTKSRVTKPRGFKLHLLDDGIGFRSDTWVDGTRRDHLATDHARASQSPDEGTTEWGEPIHDYRDPAGFYRWSVAGTPVRTTATGDTPLAAYAATHNVPFYRSDTRATPPKERPERTRGTAPQRSKTERAARASATRERDRLLRMIVAQTGYTGTITPAMRRAALDVIESRRQQMEYRRAS